MRRVAVLIRRAWRVTVIGETGIVAAATRGKAIATILKNAEEAGHKASWSDVRAVRAKEYDGWAEAIGRDTAWSEEFIKLWEVK